MHETIKCRVRHPFPDAIQNRTSDLGRNRLDSFDSQKNRTLDTALGMQRTLRLNENRLKVYRPESYENGRRSFVSGRRLVHRETQRPVRLYFIASWVHSSSAHSQSFRHNVFATNEHGFVKPYMDQQSKESISLRPRSRASGF